MSKEKESESCPQYEKTACQYEKIVCIKDMPERGKIMSELTRFTYYGQTVPIYILKDSILYKELLDATKLDASSLNCNPHIISIIAQIAALSPMLTIVDVSDNDLGPFGPTVAASFASSNSISDVSMRGNNLGQYGESVASFLRRSPYICTVDLSNNFFGEFGPTV